MELKELHTSEANDLFNKQKEMLDTFLKTGAIDKEQYDKSLNGLKEKMGVKYSYNEKEI